MEALSYFEKHQDSQGILDSLILAAPGQQPDEATRSLERAMELAGSQPESDAETARVLSRQAAHLGLSNRARSVELQTQALKIYEELGNVRGQAHCLFTLTVQENDSSTRLGYALKSADLYRSLGRLDQAAKSMSLALTFGPEDTPLTVQLGFAETGLQDAQASGKSSLEGIFYRKLAEIHARLGNAEEAEKYQRWHDTIEASDGLTPAQRKRENAKFAKQMRTWLKSTGRPEAAKIFKV